eukprot:1696844-Rhodomonas_salina.2
MGSLGMSFGGDTNASTDQVDFPRFLCAQNKVSGADSRLLAPAQHYLHDRSSEWGGTGATGDRSAVRDDVQGPSILLVCYEMPGTDGSPTAY